MSLNCWFNTQLLGLFWKRVFFGLISAAEDHSQFPAFVNLYAHDHLAEGSVIMDILVLFSLVNSCLYGRKSM